MAYADLSEPRARPQPRAVLELLKPITWFAPMWAFMCGVISSGSALGETWPFMIAGMILAGPLVCGTSQAVNDWYDRHVDAINEPKRPIPSGRIPGSWGFRIACIGTGVALIYAAFWGIWVFVAAIVGLALAWAYSAPPLRLKQSGWWGPLAVGFSYEGLSWFTGAAIVLGHLPSWEVLSLVVLYSIGAFGIMTLNDFKAVEGDRRLGIKSLPAQLGVQPAARIACIAMAVPQAFVVAMLLGLGLTLSASLVTLSLAVQIVLMIRLMKDPKAHAPWYNATGTTLFVLGMMISAFGVRQIGGGIG